LEVAIPGLPHERAVELVEKTHQVCPYSNAVQGNIDVDLKVTNN
jgi:organic hydroperoxide reductase OsmC/OhrA